MTPRILSWQASNIITALDIITDIRVYRKLRVMQTAKTAGIKVPFNNNKLRILMRHLKAIATAEGIDIPRAACRKHLIIERQPVSRAEYAIWMYSILRYSGTQLCLLYHTLSGLTDLHRVQCNSITVNQLNCAMYWISTKKHLMLIFNFSIWVLVQLSVFE